MDGVGLSLCAPPSGRWFGRGVAAMLMAWRLERRRPLRPEPAMQNAHTSSFNAFFAKLSPTLAPLSGAGRKVDCGWYDSSFELARGLEVVEQEIGRASCRERV